MERKKLLEDVGKDPSEDSCPLHVIKSLLESPAFWSKENTAAAEVEGK